MADSKIICPLMNGECIGDGAIRMEDGKPILVKCRFWVVVQGKNPQDGTMVNNGDCAFCWTPVLLIENSKVNRETGAAIESFRNEMADGNASVNQVLHQIAQQSSLPLNLLEVSTPIKKIY